MESLSLIPFYIVCDESASMEYNGGIDAINEALPELHAVIASDPRVDDMFRICVIAFSDDADVLVPPSLVSDIEEMPRVAAGGAGNCGAVFRLLKNQIATDIALYRADGFSVLRPAVLFITDEEPTDDWEQEHQALVDKSTNPLAPNMIVFRIGDDDPGTMGGVGTFPTPNPGPSGGQGARIRTVMVELIDAMTRDVVWPAGLLPQLAIPEDIEGMISLPFDGYDDDPHSPQERGN